ncbi:MAG: oligosaccharide flippase family protein [Clostridiales bacterium]|nr:oligosaccharide flippase family protein [Clostridiales bacterium]
MHREQQAGDYQSDTSPPSAPPPSIAANILSNFAGRGWGGIINLLFVPVYIRFLGIEAYGLIGVYYSMMAILAVLDLGLSSTLSRELARLTAISGKEQESRDLLRTMEFVYWLMGIIVGGIVILLAPFIAKNWIQGKGIPSETIQAALIIMGCIIAFEWPNALYTGGMIGIQRQIPFNAIRAGMATVQAVGAALLLWLVSSSILLYFVWQILVSLFQTLLLRKFLWQYMPGGSGSDKARTALLEKNWRFAAGMTGISLMATILTQMDKILLSKFLTLEAFGYYILAYNVAAALNNLIQPVFMGLFPKLSQAVFVGDEKEISSLYHKGCQLMSAIVIPAAITLAFFSREALMVWLKNEALVSGSHALLSLILCGTLLNGILTPPYMLQLAYGWTNLSFYKNVLAVAAFIWALPWLIVNYGAYGAAYAWIGLNAGYFLAEIPIMHTRLLRSDIWPWYKIDVGLPLLIAILFSLLSRTLFPLSSPLYVHLLWILLTFLSCFALTVLSMPDTRKWAIRAMN